MMVVVGVNTTGFSVDVFFTNLSGQFTTCLGHAIFIDFDFMVIH